MGRARLQHVRADIRDSGQFIGWVALTERRRVELRRAYAVPEPEDEPATVLPAANDRSENSSGKPAFPE